MGLTSFLPLALLALQFLPLGAGAQMPQADYEQRMVETIRQYVINRQRPPEVIPIIEALKGRHFDQARLLSTKLIESPGSPDDTPQFVAWLTSLGYLYRGQAAWLARKDWKAASADFKRSAQLGNVEATRFLLDAFKAANADKSALGGYMPTTAEVLEYTRVAADLGMIDAVQTLARNEDELSGGERIYLMGRLFSGRANLDRQLLLQLVNRGRDGSFDGVLAELATVGRPYPASDALPGRDAIATLYSENNLHSILVGSLGGRGRRDSDGRPASGDAPTILENFQFAGTSLSSTGLADLHLLVPGPEGRRGPNIHVMPLEKVVAETKVGDTINISCGPLSHTATVFAIDAAKDELVLVDGLSEFWKPSHNTCVTSLSYRRYKYGFYVAVLRLSEAVPMIDAIGTIRTAEFIGQAGDISLTAPGRKDPSVPCLDRSGDGSGAPAKRWNKWVETDFMRLSNLHRVQTMQSPLGTSVFYRIGKAEYFGNVGLIFSVDSQQCVRSASMTIRRPFLREARQGIDANLLIAAFLADSLNADAAGQLSPQLARIKATLDPKEKDAALDTIRVNHMNPDLVQAVAGERELYELGFAGGRLRVENIKASNGAALVRFSVW